MLFTVTSTKKFYSPSSLSKSETVFNINIVYGNLKSENSQDYAQTPQRNFTFMNSASVADQQQQPLFSKFFYSKALQKTPSQPEKKGEREETTGGTEGEHKSRPCFSSSYNSLSSSLFSAAPVLTCSSSCTRSSQTSSSCPNSILTRSSCTAQAAVSAAAVQAAVVPRAAVQVAAGPETAVSPTVATVNAACSKKKRKKKRKK